MLYLLIRVHLAIVSMLLWYECQRTSYVASGHVNTQCQGTGPASENQHANVVSIC